MQPVSSQPFRRMPFDCMFSVPDKAIILRIPENAIGAEAVFAPDRHVDGCRRQRKRIEASEFISETSLLWILTVLFFDYSFLFTGTQIALW